MREHDERWSPGSSGRDAPDEARAAYSGRWLDQGDAPADIVPDRQGYAWVDDAARKVLFTRLVRRDPRRSTPRLIRDVTAQVVCDPPFHVWMRRSGGYVYVDAWLD